MKNGAILFDKAKCKDKHPMSNDMQVECTSDCWQAMKDKMGGDTAVDKHSVQIQCLRLPTL